MTLAQSDGEPDLTALSRDEVRQLEVAAMFAELNPANALEDACLEHHRYNVGAQRERNLFARNGREATRPGRGETRYLTIDGETHSLSEWAKLRGISYGTVKERIARGMTPEQALSRKVRPYVRRDLETRLLTIDGETRTFAAWARARNIHPTTARQRIERGMSLLEAITTPVDARYSPFRHRRQARLDDETGTLLVLRDKDGSPMQTREEQPVLKQVEAHTPTPAMPSAVSDDLTSAFHRAQQRAFVKTQAEAVLAALTVDDRRNVLMELLVALEAPCPR